MQIEITDVVAIPEDFLIENHMTMRERLNYFQADFLSTENVIKLNNVIKMTGYLRIRLIPDCMNLREEQSAVASAAFYLMILDDLGLIVDSFKKLSFKMMGSGNKEEVFKDFVERLRINREPMAVNIINIFPLIQNRKFYLENAINSILKLEEQELDIEDDCDRIGNLD